MSVWHSIDCLLRASYHKDNIRAILQKGSDVGFQYVDAHYAIRQHKYEILTADVATDRLMMSIPEIDDEGGTKLYVTYLDTRFDFSIRETEDGAIRIMLWSFSHPWLKSFVYGSAVNHFDVIRYSRLLLDICDDFVIAQLHVDIE